jgi:hypothetical protein
VDGTVNWRSGQLITLATTVWKDELTNQNEVRSIKSISGDRTRITLDKPLEYQHYGYAALPSDYCRLGGSASRVALHTRMFLSRLERSVQNRLFLLGLETL